MAQRTIHYLFGEIFSQQFEIKDKTRFLLGNVLPDAYANGSDRDKTHYIVKTDTQVYFDFSKFRDEYADLICSDDLYLGYYMHLVIRFLVKILSYLLFQIVWRIILRTNSGLFFVP